jgi:outer membrane protein OmpA-like peptidoglycan-associated protein
VARGVHLEISQVIHERCKMKVLMRALSIAALSLLVVPITPAQTPVTVQVQRPDNPIYKITINVVERSIQAVNYRHRAGSTRLDFRGTPLLPTAHGEAEVEGRKGYMEVKTEIKDMQPASRFGPEFLTYVLWAITPEGRPVNLGEVLLDGNNRGVLNVTTDLQGFGLIVTAEPYFGVTQPSDVVVVENFVRPDTKGTVEQVNAKFELLQRGQYAVNVAPAQLTPMKLEKDKPLDLYQAQNAIRIARWAGADKDAPDSFAKAMALLQQAEQKQQHDPGSKAVSTDARNAVQAAEDARLIALKRQDEARVAVERAAAAERQAQAERQAAQAERQAAQAEQQQRLETERRARAEAERAAAEAEAQRHRAEAAAAADRAARERQAAQAEIDRAKQVAEQARLDQIRLRQQLVEQFNRVLETRETTRGLIVNMSGVWFDTGKATLKPGAREKLSKIAGILSGHAGLKLEVEGHTDNTGSNELNQELSERRAEAVREFLIQQGVSPASITAHGMGESQPVASNDTAAGRQLNRRVEMVVSGDIIGTTTPTSSLR